MAGLAQKAGADGVVPVTRWLSITVDVDHEGSCGEARELVDHGPPHHEWFDLSDAPCGSTRQLSI
jgi:hypothetical protein